MRILKTSPWDIDSTLLLEIHLPLELSEISEAYRIQLMKLYLIMIKLLQAVECQGIHDQLDSQLTSNDCVSLLFAAKEVILPHTSLQILDILSDISSCLQMNGEAVESLGT